MRLGNKTNIPFTNGLTTEKGCKRKYRNCYKSSSSSSCSSSSSSSSSCSSSSSSSSDASYDHLDACYGKIKNLTGTNLTYTNASITFLNLQSGFQGDIPVLVTSNINVNVPTSFSNFTSTFLLSSSNPPTIAFQSLFNSNLNGARITFANVSNGPQNFTTSLISPNVFYFSGTTLSTFSATIQTNTNIQFATLFTSNNAILYRLQ